MLPSPAAVLHPLVIHRFTEFPTGCDPALRADLYARLEGGDDLLAARLTLARAEAPEGLIAAIVFLQARAILPWASGRAPRSRRCCAAARR
jgi:hypothetical protein